MNAIKAEKLSKSFGNTKALSNLSIEVEKGQIFGLLGANGAGKTTLIKTFIGAARPTSGTTEVLGKDPLKDKKELRDKIGYMPQDHCLYEDLSAKDNVRFFASLHKSKKVANKEIDKRLDFLGLKSRKNDKIHGFSGGMKKRVSLAAAMIHNPEILFLDEPTAALDPSLKRELWKIFRDLAGKGKTLFISTHLMDEVMLCDNLAILKEGAVLTKGTPSGIMSKGNMSIKINHKEGETKEHVVESDKNALAKHLHGYGLDESIESIEIEKDSIEDIMIKLVEGDKN